MPPVAIGSRPAGQVYQGDRRFDVVVRLGDDLRQDPAALDGVPIPLSHEDDALERVALAADDVRRFTPRVLPLDAMTTTSSRRRAAPQ
jgi:cobalt-zinc-cadmium resistance protein CzcA